MGNSAIDEDVARLLFDDEEGLGLDIFRYNVGGGESENPNSRIWGDWAKTESFYVYNEQSGKYEMDFSRDANARKMMDLAVKYGASEIVLFCNSPHFSMTLSGQASGGLEADLSNLPPENYELFADYLLAVADHFVDLGYPIKYISPINEPQWGWGGVWVGQEGCHYTPEETVALLELFALKMQAKNTPYKLSGPENGTMAEGSFDYQEKFFESDILRNYCDTYSGHTYWMDNDIEGKKNAGKRFASSFPGKKFEMSEWCELPCTLDSDSIQSALYMANIIQQDLTLLNASSWQSWTAVSRHEEKDEVVRSDTLLRVDPTYSEIRFNKRYFAFLRFTREIPKESVRVKVIKGKELKSLETVAFKSEGKLTLVVINNDINPVTINLRNRCAFMSHYLTDAANDDLCVYRGPVLSAIDLPAESISTLVFYV